MLEFIVALPSFMFWIISKCYSKLILGIYQDLLFKIGEEGRERYCEDEV